MLALALAAHPGCATLDAPTVTDAPPRHALRINRGVFELVDGSVVLAGPGRWYSVTGGERLEHEWARVQVEKAQVQARLSEAEARPLVPPGGVSYGAVAVVGLAALAAGVLAGGLLLR